MANKNGKNNTTNKKSSAKATTGKVKLKGSSASKKANKGKQK